MKKVIAVFILFIITALGVMASRNSKLQVVEPDARSSNFVSQNKSDVGTWD